MTFINALSLIVTGYLFATGAIIAWILFQLIMLLLKDIYITCVMKKLKNKSPSKKPKDMEFGGFGK